MKKRVFSLFLALVMLFSLLPAAIPAAAEEDLTAPTELDTVLPQEPVEDSGLAAEPTEEPKPSSEPEPEPELEPELPAEPAMPDAGPEPSVPSEGRGSVVPFEAGDGKDDNTGVCGPNLTWVLLESGTLIISGSGAMSNYDWNSPNAPWYAKRKEITAVVLDPGVTSIGAYAFYYCTNLSSVTIPDSITSIGNYAFSQCSSLTSISLPEGLTSIDSYAFRGCTSLTSIMIPKSVASLGSGWICGCSSLTAIQIAEGNANYCIVDGALYDKAMTTLEAVPPAFSGTFAIPEGVKFLRSFAFSSCAGLTGVTFPESLFDIGAYAFENCYSLGTVTLPPRLTTINRCVFDQCRSLTSVVFPEGLHTVSQWSFRGCSSLTSVSLPETVTKIYAGAFESCSSLTSAPLPSGITCVDEYLFRNCTSLTSVVIPEGVTKIEFRAFSGCSSLTSVSIPESVTSIGNLAFESCSKLTGIVLPSGLKSIDRGTFESSGLTSIVIPEGVTSIGEYSFWYCDNLKSVTIPASVESIGDDAFCACNSLIQVRFLHETTHFTLGNSVFYYNGFSSYMPYRLTICVQNLDYIPTELLDYDWAGDNRKATFSLYNGEPEDPAGPDEPEEPEEPEEPVGDVGECTLWYSDTSKHFDHDLTYYVSNSSSTQYVQPLAAMLSTLACAAYNSDSIAKSMNSMEFTYSTENLHNYGSDSGLVYRYAHDVGYSFAYKKADDGSTVVAVLIRGSSNLENWIRDFTITCLPGPHPGFKLAEMDIYRDLCNYLSGFTGNIKIAVTGHSMGAGVGCLLSKHLLDSGVVSPENLYSYLFACPDCAVGGAGSWNPGGCYDCIFNISNVCDVVGVVPGGLGDLVNLGFIGNLGPMAGSQLSWGKYGQTYYYSTDWNDRNCVTLGNPVVHHSSARYVSHIGSSVGAQGNFKTWAESREIMKAVAGPDLRRGALDGFVFALFCPVDIVLTDASGAPIAAVINNEPVYYDTGCSAETGVPHTFIWVEGDHKYIYVNSTEEVHARLSGTDEGEMAFAVLEVNELQDGKALANFEHVALASGKAFVSEVPKDTGTEAVHLYVVDAADTPLAEVEPDGSEVLLSPVPELQLDHDYLILTPGETAELSVLDLPEDRLADLSWTTESEAASVITMDHGTVTAVGPGTDYAVASLTLPESGQVLTARCRIDVVEGEEGEEHPIAADVNEKVDTVSGVRLTASKVTVELFKTDYTRIQILPELTHNYKTAQTTLLPTPAPAGDAGAAVESARFTVPAVADLFSLRVVDDRTLELIPTQAALDNNKLVKGSYPSPIAVTLDGTEFETGPLTVTVKKTEPKLTAKAVTLNSFLRDTQRVSFSGGTVLSAAPDKPLPDWLRWDSEAQSFTYLGAKDAKQSAKVTLLVSPAGWAVQRPVTVSVSAKSTAPKLSFKPASLTLKPGTGDSAATSWTLSPALFAGETVTLSRISEGKTDYANGEVLNVSLQDGSAVVTAPAVDGRAHSYKVWLAVAGKEYAFTVKTLADKQAVSLTLKAAGSIDLAVPGSPVTITASTKNFHVDQAAFTLDSICLAKTTEDLSSRFSITGSGSRFTVTALGDPQPGTYTATITADLGGKALSKSVNFTVKRSSKVPAAALSLKASGSIDVLRPGTSVTVTPTVKNRYGYTLFPDDIRITRTYDGTRKCKVQEDATGLFSVAVQNGKYTITALPGAQVSHADKFSVQATVAGLSSKAVALSVKQGSARLGLSSKSVTLLKTDRYSRGNLLLSVMDPSLAGIARVELDSKSKNSSLFSLLDLGGGRYAIGYAGGLITTSKAQTVKLQVYLIGNETAKPNATLSVKVNFA